MGQIEATYLQRTPGSAALAVRAERCMPGGVDGHCYIELIGNFTSLVHGNAYPPIVEAVARRLSLGSQWPARNVHQVQLAELIVERVRSVQQVRFCNSGTEATMLAAYIARTVTGRHKILMAKHGYHGSLEEFEVGFFGHEGADTLLARHGDAVSFEAVLLNHGADIACVILEPVMGSAGLVASPEGFLPRVRSAAQAAGALFVLDEVITLRLGTGGAQANYGVEPDLTAMGKIIGGGFPVGAVGGRAELMAVMDPRKPRLFHSGTFNGNPITTAAGVVSLAHLTSDQIAIMDRQVERIAEGLQRGAASVGLPFSVNRAGSMLQCSIADTPPEATLTRRDALEMARFHLAALNHGLFFAGRGMLALSTVTTDELVEEVIERGHAALVDAAQEM